VAWRFKDKINEDVGSSIEVEDIKKWQSTPEVDGRLLSTA
jgi:hypothetical protein